MGTFWICMMLAAAPAEVEVKPLSGDAVRGTLAAWESQTVVVDSSAGRKTFPLNLIASITFSATTQPKTAPPIAVELIDGSMAVGATLTAGAAGVTLGTDAGPLELPLEAVRSIRLQPHGETTAAQWNKVCESRTASDALVTRKADTLDYLKGVVRAISNDSVTFEVDGETIPVKRGKVFGVVFHQVAGRRLPDAIGRLTDASGATWAIHSARLQRDAVHWTTPAGVQLSRATAQLVRADFSSGNVVYLSDLPTESVDWSPFFQLGRAPDVRREMSLPRKDRALLAGPLQLDGKEYAKGLAIRSRTTLVYRLPDRFRTFSAIVGIDDRVRPGGHVQLTIRGDQRVLLETTVAGTQPAKTLTLDTTGVRRLTVVVDFGDEMDIADHLDLCEAKLVK